VPVRACPAHTAAHGCLPLSCRLWVTCVLSLSGAALCLACPAPTTAAHGCLPLSCSLKRWVTCVLSLSDAALCLSCPAPTAAMHGCLALSCTLWVSWVLSLSGAVWRPFQMEGKLPDPTLLLRGACSTAASVLQVKGGMCLLVLEARVGCTHHCSWRLFATMLLLSCR
jgi:hypothetical protein